MKISHRTASDFAIISTPPWLSCICSTLEVLLPEPLGVFVAFFEWKPARWCCIFQRIEGELRRLKQE
ncbi:MAG: hypothetical protein AAFU83_04085, partial [Bacteroidota bacterium]